MQVPTDSFFRIFQPDLRGALQWFFDNRRTRITSEIAVAEITHETFERLNALQLIDVDVQSGDCRLDDRLEQFLDSMLGSAEVAQADWLMSLLSEIRRSIDGYNKIGSFAKGEALLRRICVHLRTCKSRIQRHLEELKAAVDFDYRTGSDYEIKLLRLEWHLERAKDYGNAVSNLDTLLRNDAFFQVNQEISLISLRNDVIYRCSKVGDALVEIYQSIEDYLNRVQRDYARARKLFRLCSFIDRHEWSSATNLGDISSFASGPWFFDFQYRTILDPALIDTRPELHLRALERAGLGQTTTKPKRVELNLAPLDDLPPVITPARISSDIYQAAAA